MKDTSEPVLEIWQRNLVSKSSQERVEMACSMFEFSRQLVIASLMVVDPNLTELQVKREVFRRFYRGDFPAEEFLRIENALFS